MTKEELKSLVKQAGTLELTDSERKKAGGEFISLPCGNTHYELKGDENGEPCVLVHGYATPYYIYDKVFDRLVAEGYRVLRYDLLGRGLSERVKADYTAAFFAAQLHELTEAIFGEKSFNLFGTSMGGSITTAFCASYPEKVKRLVLLAPAGMDSFKPPFYMHLSAIPGIGNVVFNIIGNKTLLTKCASELKHTPQDEVDYFMRSFAYSIKYKGFLKCTLSSLKNTILATKEDTKGYIKTAQTDIPVLCLWGTEDKTMPYYQAERFKEVMPAAKLVTFEGSGHVFLFDEGERTMAEVIPFLKNAASGN